jgi:hypothetical protein
VNNGITVCPKCNRQLRNINAWHYCAEVSMDDLFADKPDEVVLIFDELLQKISAWDNVAVSATKNCVVFVKNKTFLVLKPMTKCLEVKFYATDPIEDEDLYKCNLWNKKYEGVIRLQNIQQLNSKIFNYIRESYQIS